jgi:hypothetical protein
MHLIFLAIDLLNRAPWASPAQEQDGAGALIDHLECLVEGKAIVNVARQRPDAPKTTAATLKGQNPHKRTRTRTSIRVRKLAGVLRSAIERHSM